MTILLNKNSTLQKIKYPLKQHILEKLDITEDMFDDVAITFSMIDDETGRYRVANSEANLEIIENDYERLDESKYTLTYKPKLKDTKYSGIFRGEFVVDFLGENGCGKIKFPLDEHIQIIILDSITKTTLN